jgi:hypothetical protein
MDKHFSSLLHPKVLESLEKHPQRVVESAPSLTQDLLLHHWIVAFFIIIIIFNSADSLLIKDCYAPNLMETPISI